MLNLILGRAGSGKTSYLRNLMAELAENDSRRMILIVPEQATFSNEKAILEKMTPRLAQKVEVYSFTRLASKVLTDAGKITGVRLDGGGRAMLMSRAVNMVSDDLILYRKASGNNIFCEKVLRTITELKICGITAKELRIASRGLNGGIISAKLNEIALIADAYESLEGERFSDTEDDLTKFAEYLKTDNLFEDINVFIDSFSGFTVQELNVIESIITGSENVYVALCTDEINECDDKLDIFYPAKYTAQKLIQLAEKNRIKVVAPVKLSKNFRAENDELRTLEKGIFSGEDSNVYDNVTDKIQLTVCEDIHDECDYIAREIRELLRTQNMRCRDIAVISRDGDKFDILLKRALKKCGVPVFEDSRQPIEYQPLIKLVGFAFDIVNSSFDTQDILRYIKCGLVSLSSEETAELEDYVIMWKISGSRWKNEFILHPRGFQSVMTSDDSEKLHRLNQIRNKIITPLLKFAKSVKQNSGLEMAKAIYQLLDDANIQEGLKNMAESFESDGEPALSDELGRIWDMFMDILDQIVLVLGDTILTSKQFSGLYNIIIESKDIGSIPQGIDEVTIGNADRMRTDDPKVVFIAGANEGIFPCNPTDSGLFTLNDRDILVEKGLEIHNTYKNQMLLEYMSSYAALTSASERLYVSYRRSESDGGSISPSVIVNEIERIFPKLKKCDTNLKKDIDSLSAKLPAFELMSEIFKDNTVFSETLKQYFRTDSEYKEKFKAVEDAASKNPIRFESSEKATELFGKNLYLTATKVEDFYNCPFKYFCKFGMKVYPKTVAELNPMQTGTVMHFVLENLVRKYGGSGLSKLEEKQLVREIKRLLNEFLEQNMGGIQEKTSRFIYLFNRMANTVYTVVKHLAREFEQSEFQPVDFELRINKDSEIRPTELETPDGSIVSVYGVVDRVDTMVKDGITYLRVVDYKTGNKIFELDEVLMGLNMQMLIYLFAIWRNGGKKYGEITPSGVLYMPAFVPYVSMERSAKLDDIEASKDKSLRMNGLVLNDPKVISGMEKNIAGVFIPVSIKKDEVTGSLVTLEYLGELEKNINQLLINIAMTLHEGEVSPKPYRHDKKDACKYCDYRKICNYEG